MTLAVRRGIGKTAVVTALMLARPVDRQASRRCDAARSSGTTLKAMSELVGTLRQQDKHAEAAKVEREVAAVMQSCPMM